MIIDIIVLAYVAFSIFAGYKKGLIGVLSSFVGFIIAIVLAFVLEPQVVNFLNNDTHVATTIENGIKSGVSQALQQKQDNLQGTNKFYSGIINNFANETADEISYNITQFVLKGVSFIAVYIIVIIIMYIIESLLNLVFDLPILKSINKTGGIVINILMAIFKVWIILAIISFLVPFGSMQQVVNAINNTHVTKYLFDNNVIVSFLGKDVFKNIK